MDFQQIPEGEFWHAQPVLHHNDFSAIQLPMTVLPSKKDLNLNPEEGVGFPSLGTQFQPMDSTYSLYLLFLYSLKFSIFTLILC